MAEADRLGLAALALTDHHGFYGVVRFAEAARACGLPTVFGTEVTLAPASPRTGEADPTGTHLVVLARDPDGYARLSTVLADAHLGGGEKGRPVFTLHALARAAGGHWLVLSGCRKGAVPAALMDAGPRAASREVGRLVDSVRTRQRRTGAVGPRGPPRHGAQRRAGASRRHLGRRRRGDQQRALRDAGRVPARHHARRGAGAPAPGRARGLAAVGPDRLPALRRRAVPALRPLARCGRARRRARAGLRVRPAPGRAAAAGLPRARGHGRAGLSAPAGDRGRDGALRAARRRAGARGMEADRPRARGDRHARLRRLLPRGVGHRAGVQAVGHLLPGARLGGQLGRLLRARRHQRRRRRSRAALRALPLAGAGRPAGHRRGHRVRAAGGGDPVRVRALRPPPRRAGGQRHHLPAALGRPRRRQGVRLHPRAGGRLGGRHRRRVRARPVVGGRRGGGGGVRRVPGWWRAAAGGRAGGRGARPAAPSRHPLGRHGAVRPAGGRGLPGGVGPHAGAQRAAVGQGRLRRHRAGEVRPARPRHARGAAPHGRPGARLPRHRHRPGAAAPGGRGLRPAVPGRHGRRLPGREPGPDGDAAPGRAAHLLRHRH